MNYIRSEAEFLQKNPQEFIASICNAYFANTRWVFDLGLERLKMGFKEPLNQFLFFAEIFSLGRNTTPFFLIDRYGNVSVTQVQIYRDDNSNITQHSNQPPKSVKKYLEDRRIKVVDNLRPESVSVRSFS